MGVNTSAAAYLSYAWNAIRCNSSLRPERSAVVNCNKSPTLTERAPKEQLTNFPLSGNPGHSSTKASGCGEEAAFHELQHSVLQLLLQATPHAATPKPSSHACKDTKKCCLSLQWHSVASLHQGRNACNRVSQAMLRYTPWGVGIHLEVGGKG